MSDRPRPIRDGFSSLSHEPVAQTFFGFRAFKVHNHPEDPYATGPAESGLRYAQDAAERGALRGIFKCHYQWGAGTNQAVCLRYAQRQAGVGAATPQRVKGKPHELLMPECDCGFWAYTNGDHLLSVSGPTVLGVIEGWGECVLGPDGFRAEKARVVALAFPTRDEADTDDASIDAASAHLLDAVAMAKHAMMTAFVGFSHAAARLHSSFAGKPLPPPVLPTLRQPERSRRPWELVDDELRAAVERAYPHARVFSSVAAMHAEFPLSDLRGLLPKPGKGGESS